MIHRMLGRLAVTLALLAYASTGFAEPAASVDGFRSAKFGMEEAAVRKAAVADFGKEAARRISADTNALEKTKILSLTVDDLLPASGPARVSYVFGYASRKLVQVNVVWLAEKPGERDLERLRDLVLTLQAFFLKQGYQKDSVTTEGVLADGTQVAFRGTDEKGRMTLLRYFFGRADDKAKTAPVYVNLAYMANPDNPDVFHLKPGQF